MIKNDVVYVGVQPYYCELAYIFILAEISIFILW